MSGYVRVGNMQVASVLYEFIHSEVLPDSKVDNFWLQFEQLIKDLTPENKALLEQRKKMQQEINSWHIANSDFDMDQYKSFLQTIGYLEKEVEDFEITTKNVDDEITLQAGPQLVVPVNNPRYAINAANARWGSLYDGLYGTDAISEEDGCERGDSFNPKRGEKVIAYGKQFLDQSFPLNIGSHKNVVKYSLFKGKLQAVLINDQIAELKDNSKLVGYLGSLDNPDSIVVKNNQLHVEIQIDDTDPIGMGDIAGVKDIVLESALTTIMDCEDSVAAVDAEDKVDVYRNWLGLISGQLTTSFQKGNKEINRTLHPDRVYTSLTGSTYTLPGRSLMLIRNVGHLMTSNAVLDENGEEVPEGILDGIITSLIAKRDILNSGIYINSGKGSIYIVKPKMHGSREVSFANKLFNRIEDMLGLKRYTIKIGIMDEERRTTLNLKNCIYEVKERIVFINTGFLDRTGDEIHTSMEVGPMYRKKDMKSSPWLQAYEKSNVAVGLATGLKGRAQIGKGMWAMPDLMADMLKQKVGQLHAGANTAWVPSPTAATLHVLHYHKVDVVMTQKKLVSQKTRYLNDILTFPVIDQPSWSSEEIQEQLDNNIQGILGYVVRWINQGIGCSKVPDIDHVALMEDRATLRISSQHVANWLHHQICSIEQVEETLKRMAKIVDKQNASDRNYISMSNNYADSVAFQAASDLIFEGYHQPNGYTEPILHRRRIEAKIQYINN
ncbi:malate synthase G [Aquibacillus saliphilus]|uniref:malate synthase G n=1 Tax=Aquibacillus saliphilus TaxID=1909422 RepID=UPI001CF07DF4|nr:malate synthase G [Aquibacillus saliphilus]